MVTRSDWRLRRTAGQRPPGAPFTDQPATHVEILAPFPPIRFDQRALLHLARAAHIGTFICAHKYRPSPSCPLQFTNTILPSIWRNTNRAPEGGNRRHLRRQTNMRAGLWQRRDTSYCIFLLGVHVSLQKRFPGGRTITRARSEGGEGEDKMIDLPTPFPIYHHIEGADGRQQD